MSEKIFAAVKKGLRKQTKVINKDISKKHKKKGPQELIIIPVIRIGFYCMLAYYLVKPLFY